MNLKAIRLSSFRDELNKIALSFSCGDEIQYFKDHPDKLKERIARDKAKKAKKMTKTAQPSVAQAEAGNYKMGHRKYNGMDISIENPVGSIRSGVSKDGHEWHIKMNHAYGYIRKTLGRDKDQIDIFIKPGTKETEKVFIVNQINPKTKTFDEHKVMLGFITEDEAKKAYLSNYDKGWKGIGSIVMMSIKAFKKWVYAGRKMGPAKTIKEQIMKKESAVQEAYQNGFKEEIKKIATEGAKTNETNTTILETPAVVAQSTK